MTLKTINVLLLEDSPDYAELVQQWLSTGNDDVRFSLSWTDSLAAGLNRLGKGGTDVVLLDLGLPDSEGRDTFAAMMGRAIGIPIIILSSADSESLALRLIQDGAEDYLVKSKCTGDTLIRALRYAVVRHKWQAGAGGATRDAERARFIGVVGSKGGVGTTTVACSVAAALAEESGERVLLADLNVNSGMVSFLMGIDSKYSVLDALGNLERLDRACCESIVARHTDRLDILASPNGMLQEQLPVEGVRNAFNAIAPFYRWIVADLGSPNPVSLAMVTTTAIPALFAAKRLIDSWHDLLINRERVRLIVNLADAVQPISGSELNHLFGTRVCARLPNDGPELHEACMQRRVPSATSAFGRELMSVARKIAGLQEKKTKWNRPEFLSFINRFRKPPELSPGAGAGR
jgi:MinD-like ATPase involved in chromosome partitioning or flagellar assembly/CheY-like chemotaxis protein